MRYIYNLLFYILLPFILLRLFWRSHKIPAYRQRVLERFGIFAAPPFKHCIWIHAVSFGEAKVATHLIQALQKQHPDLKFVVTTMTVTGSQQIQQIVSDKIFHVYIPYDVPGSVKRFLKRIQPTLLILIETELWPTLLHQCRQQKIPTVIANARLSEKSFQKYRQIYFFMKYLLKNVSQIWTQTTADAERFVQLGAAKENVLTLGNIKFDVTPPPSLLEAGKKLKMQLQQRPVFIASSTHAGEEILVLEAFQQIRQTIPDCFLILVPRHPERFSEVAALCRQQHYTVVRRTENKTEYNHVDILLGDTLGELWFYYAAADIAFVGGSLINQGGHNLLEPAALGLPIISGNYYANFKQITDLLLQANAIILVNNATALAQAVIHLWQNPALRQQQGQNALTVVMQNHGALEKYCLEINALLYVTPRRRPRDPENMGVMT